MKTVLAVTGAFITVAASYKILHAFFSVSQFSNYGKGYIVGNSILLVAGLFILFVALRKKKKEE